MERWRKNLFCSLSLIACCFFPGMSHWIPKSTISHNCTAKQLFLCRQNKALLHPRGTSNLETVRQTAFGTLSMPEWLLWTDIMVFLKTWLSTKVQQHCCAQMLWHWGFCGLCRIHITEAFHYTKNIRIKWGRNATEAMGDSSSTCQPVSSLLSWEISAAWW